MAENKHDFLAIQVKLGGVDNKVLKDEGLSTENTELKDKSYYESNETIKERFKDDEGNFDQDGFNQFYDGVKKNYISLDKEDSASRMEDSFKVLDSDFAYVAGYNVIKPNEQISVSQINNRLGATYGFKDFGISEDPIYTISEAAQKEFVYDADGKELNISAEDYNRKFENLDKTLVLAQYDKGGKYEENGVLVDKKKGDYKLNKDGGYYYEELGDKDSFGKQALSYFDTLTNEGSFANKYDFMDSDGRDKNAAGIIVKAAIKTIPLFIPGVNTIYGGALVAASLAEAFPKLTKTIMGMSDDKAESSEFYKKMNKLESLSKKFNSSGLSEKGSASMFSLESLANMTYDSFAQLRGQQLVAKGAYGALAGANMMRGVAAKSPEMMKAMKSSEWIAKSLSTMYLAITASSQMYDATKGADLDENARGALYLGYTAALFGLFSSGQYAQLALKGIGYDDYTRQLNTAINKKRCCFRLQRNMDNKPR